MQEQMEQQLKQLQQGVLAAFGHGVRLTAPVLRTNEILVDGFTQCFEDQLAFGRACLDIGRKQMQGATEGTDYFSVFGDQNAMTAYCAAASQYGEALRNNAQHMRAQMASISRDAVAAGGSGAAPDQIAQPAAVAPQQPAATPTQAASRTTARKAAPKTAAKPARKAPAKAKNKTASAPPAKKAQKKTAKPTSPAPPAPSTRSTPATDTANKAGTAEQAPTQAKPGSSSSKASAGVADSAQQAVGKTTPKPSKKD